MAKFYTPFKLSENIRETPEGYLFCLGVPIARTGWQVYGEGESPLEVGEDGTARAYRDPKEVFRPETIASFQGKSVTIKHPRDFVTPDNWAHLTKGSVQNVRPGDEPDEDGEQSLLADLLITDSFAIQLVKNGLREVSCGYEAEYEQTGEGEGRQYNIVGNHVALVEEGRAGSSYAINDHKGKASMSAKLIEKLKAKFGAKVVDEALAEEKKEDKSKDAGAYDEMMKKVTDLMEKVEGLLANQKAKDDAEGEEKEKPEAKDDDEEKKPEEKKEEKAKDDDKAKDEDGAESEILERVKALEAAVAKLLEMESEEAEEANDDDEGEESEEAEDDDEEASEHMTGDAARVEILAPGLKPAKKGEDIKQRALVAAFGTKDGREVIEQLTGSKKLVLDSAEKINTLFIAASEVLKAKRGTGLERTKDASSYQFKDGDTSATAPMTAEKMNEINAQHWANRK